MSGMDRAAPPLHELSTVDELRGRIAQLEAAIASITTQLQHPEAAFVHKGLSPAEIAVWRIRAADAREHRVAEIIAARAKLHALSHDEEREVVRLRRRVQVLEREGADLRGARDELRQALEGLRQVAPVAPAPEPAAVAPMPGPPYASVAEAEHALLLLRNQRGPLQLAIGLEGANGPHRAALIRRLDELSVALRATEHWVSVEKRALSKESTLLRLLMPVLLRCPDLSPFEQEVLAKAQELLAYIEARRSLANG